MRRNGSTSDDAVIYAVGDVHGCVEELREALAWCSADASARGMRGEVVLLGDYVDRGPDSAAVLETLFRGPSDPHMAWLPIRGNHDDMLDRLLRDPSDPCASAWWEHGGQQTLASYGWNPAEHPLPSDLNDWIPGRHAAFLRGLPLWRDYGFALFVHAGVRPGIPVERQAERDLLWIRGDFTRADHRLGRLVVHGHSPTKRREVEAMRLNLDGGCFMGGPLMVAAFDPECPSPRLAGFGAQGFVPAQIVDAKDSLG